MRQTCFISENQPTSAIDIKEVGPIPNLEDITLHEYPTPVFYNYIQAINRLSVDIKTARVFPAFLSKQNEFINENIFYFSITKPTLTESQDISQTIENWGFYLRNKQEIINYLQEYSELIPYIQETKAVINIHFNKPLLILDVVIDPEENSKLLFIYIQTNLSAKQALTKLNQIDEDWWLEISEEIGDLMCLHIEYQ